MNIKCLECGMPAEYMRTGTDEFLCEDCAKTIAFDSAYNQGEFTAMENVSEENLEKIINN